MIDLNVDGEKVAKDRSKGYNKKQDDDLPEDPTRVKHIPFYQKMFPQENNSHSNRNINQNNKDTEHTALEKETKTKTFKTSSPSYPMAMTYF